MKERKEISIAFFVWSNFQELTIRTKLVLRRGTVHPKQNNKPIVIQNKSQHMQHIEANFMAIYTPFFFYQRHKSLLHINHYRKKKKSSSISFSSHEKPRLAGHELISQLHDLQTNVYIKQKRLHTDIKITNAVAPLRCNGEERDVPCSDFL